MSFFTKALFFAFEYFNILLKIAKGRFFLVLIKGIKENTFHQLSLTNSNFPPLFVVKFCQICQIQWNFMLQVSNTKENLPLLG